MSRAENGAIGANHPVRFVDALRVRAFAVLFAAELQSVAGDQFARVALSVLVFRRSGSAALTGLVFATTFLPAIFGGAMLGSLGDRFPRRLVMVVVDVIRACAFAAMAVPGLPTAALVTLLIAATFVGPLFNSAGVSYLAAALQPEVFRVATGLRMLGNQGAQFAGFAVGGALVAGLGPQSVLALDAATFVASALLVGGLAPAPAADSEPRTAPGPEQRHTAGAAQAPQGAAAVLWADHRVRALVALSALSGFFIAPEGLAVPFAERWSDSAGRAGLLLSAIPLGSAVGVYVLVRRIRPARRMAVAAGMAVGCGVPLFVSGLAVSYPAAFVCWFVSGLCAAYQVEVLTKIVQAIPDELRAGAIGICNAILLGAQGLGVAAFGKVGDVFSPAKAVAAAGLLGAVAAGCLVIYVRRASAVPA